MVAQTPSLCNAGWLEQATAADVERLIQQGADPNRLCGNGNRPIHQALLPTVLVDPAILQALVTAGADLYVESVDAETAVEMAYARYDRAATDFQERRITLDEFQVWTARFNVIRTADEARSSALRNLCDSAWWRSASGKSMAALLDSVGEFDPNRP